MSIKDALIWTVFVLLSLGCSEEPPPEPNDPLVGRWDNYQFYSTHFTRTIYEFSSTGEFQIKVNDELQQQGTWIHISGDLSSNEGRYRWTFQEQEATTQKTVRIVYTNQQLRAKIFFEEGQLSAPMTISKLP